MDGTLDDISNSRQGSLQEKFEKKVVAALVVSLDIRQFTG